MNKFYGIALLLACAACNLKSPSKITQNPSVIQIPNTPAGNKVRALINVINTGDDNACHDFISKNYAATTLQQNPIDKETNFFCRVHRDIYHLVPISATQASPDTIDVVTYSDVTESDVTFHMQVQPAAPHLITKNTIRWRMLPHKSTDTAHKKLSQADIIEALEQYIEKLVKADLFSGVVLVAKDHKVIFSEAYGQASKAWGISNNIDTKFNLGSMNKMFTGIAIAQLAEQGKLSFSDTIEHLLPNYPNKQVAKKITIEQLLSHSSGLGDYFNDEYQNASKLRYLEISDYLPLFVNEPLAFKPGTAYQYSNTGFMILGAIIEHVSGQTYFDYVRDHIYKPMGMTNTDCYQLNYDIPNLAVGYTSPEGKIDDPSLKTQRPNNLFLHIVKGGPAGGGYSTAPDLLKFALALESNKLLSPAYTKLMTTATPKPYDPNNKYAYGFINWQINGPRVYGHNGIFPGINSTLNIYPDLNYIVVVMANYSSPAAQLVSNKLQVLITQAAT